MCLEPDSLSSALACPLDLEASQLAEGLLPYCMQTTKAYRKESCVGGKGSAPGCVPKLLLGNTDSALNGGNQGPSAPAWGGSSTARVFLRLCPESALQTGLPWSSAPEQSRVHVVWGLPLCLWAP